MRVVALYRVSTEKQAEQGASLDAQERAYREHAAKNGWETVAEFRGCESATQAASDRRVLQQVLACIRDRAPDAVYVHEQSRLTRGDELEVAVLMRELKERRLKIIVNGVVRNLDSIDERFMVGIQSLVDRAESERIKERMQRGKREKGRKGLKNSGPAPYGYRNPRADEPKRGTLQVVSERAATIRKLFALAAGGLGDQAVAAALNELGMPAPRGGSWGKSSVRRVLDNPAYIGTAVSGVWRAAKPRSFRRDLKAPGAVMFPNAHEPVIDRAVWDQVHGRARLPRTAVPRMLTGLLYVNGRPCSGDSSRHGCFYRACRGVTGAPWLHAGPTDKAVWDAFASLATGTEFVQRIMEEAHNPGEQAVLAQEMDYLAEQIGKQQRRLDNLVEMRADGEIPKAVFQAKTDEARKAIATLGAELAGLRSKAVVMDGTVAARVAKAVQVLLAGWTALSLEQKRGIMGSIVRRVDVAVEPTGAAQTRGGGGAFAAAGGPRWAVKTVSFRLAIPPEGTPHGATSAATGPTAAEAAVGGAGRGDGRLATTY